MTKGGVKDLLPQSRKSRNINPATEKHPLHHSWIAIIITLNLKKMKIIDERHQTKHNEDDRYDLWLWCTAESTVAHYQTQKLRGKNTKKKR